LFRGPDDIPKAYKQFKSSLTIYIFLNHQQSQEVHTALYGTDWYRLSPAFKRLVPMMLLRASTAVKLRNGVFNDLCFATFSRVSSVVFKDLPDT
jgi:hypothetical protein